MGHLLLGPGRTGALATGQTSQVCCWTSTICDKRKCHLSRAPLSVTTGPPDLGSLSRSGRLCAGASSHRVGQVGAYPFPPNPAWATPQSHTVCACVRPRRVWLMTTAAHLSDRMHHELGCAQHHDAYGRALSPCENAVSSLVMNSNRQARPSSVWRRARRIASPICPGFSTRSLQPPRSFARLA